MQSSAVNDTKQALLGHSPKGLGKPDIHHGGQMPGVAKHEVLPEQHRNNKAHHPNKYNQGVTPEMREQDRLLHWWYRASKIVFSPDIIDCIVFWTQNPKYCYANYSEKAVCNNVKNCDVNSPLLCGNIENIDKITERKLKSLKVQQLSIFDI